MSKKVKAVIAQAVTKIKESIFYDSSKLSQHQVMIKAINHNRIENKAEEKTTIVNRNELEALAQVAENSQADFRHVANKQLNILARVNRDSKSKNEKLLCRNTAYDSLKQLQAIALQYKLSVMNQKAKAKAQSKKAQAKKS